MNFLLLYEASCGAVAQVCDCKSDWLWVQSPFEEIIYLYKFIGWLVGSLIMAFRACLYKFIFSLLRFGVEVKELNTQCLYSTENGEQNVLAQGSL